MRNVVLVLALICVNAAFAQDTDTINTRFGKGLYNVVAKDNSWSMKFGVRFQTLFVGENVINETDGFQPGTSQFLIRRSRLKFGGHAFTPKLKYKIEFGLSNRDVGKVATDNNLAPRIILDAVLKWNFYKNFTLWAGQTKLPGNRERVISSANMQFVDRSLLNKNFNIDRDIGVQLRHHFTMGKNFRVQKMFAVSQGEGRNLTQNNLGGLQYTGRVELLPFGQFASKGDYVGAAIKREEKPKLSLAFTYDYNDRAVKTRSNMGSYMWDNSEGNDDGLFNSNITTIFADMMFKYKGVSVMAEYANRNADIINHYSADSTNTASVMAGSGLNVNLGYMFKNNWEVAGRVATYTPHVDYVDNAEQRYTLAVSRYIVGHALKVQGDVTYKMEDNSTNSALMYRLQIDIHF
ncbi:OprO/OprP family phosphate-selective porin [Crocinitomicaceae bacterium]|nr:OprO/OprP family phosphate-selective porin [Crocinitomicaceae bacterium]MDB3907059.1 OprO/OprP family phosphate-selective porin [Crocinitomicaceae bacterium]